jgi:hypothetical protein
MQHSSSSLFEEATHRGLALQEMPCWPSMNAKIHIRMQRAAV